MAELLHAQVSAARGRFRLAARFTLTSQWTVLFGHSGAGKSTLLRVLAGLDTPFHARVVLNGLVLTDTAAGVAVGTGTGDGRRIGFVTQQAALFPHLTVRANVAFGLAGWGRADRDARVDEMLSLFGAEKLADRRPAGLSGGEGQRVALARALAPRPELLLLDEPFAALDGAARGAMISALRECGVPVLYVSHDLADAWQRNADALVLEAGRVVAQGEARVVLADYRERLLDQLR